MMELEQAIEAQSTPKGFHLGSPGCKNRLLPLRRPFFLHGSGYQVAERHEWLTSQQGELI
jgi:hypothetical protein